MKKLSLLIALCMLISIGGVYASWTYPGEGTSDNRNIPINITLPTEELGGAAGVYTVEENTLTVEIENAGNYTPYLSVTGHILIKFTPTSGISDTALTDALTGAMVFHAEYLDNAVLTEENYGNFPAELGRIYQVDESKDTLQMSQTSGTNQWVWSDEEGAYLFEITPAHFSAFVTINPNISLNTVEKYLAFEQVYVKAHFHLDVVTNSSIASH